MPRTIFAFYRTKYPACASIDESQLKVERAKMKALSTVVGLIPIVVIVILVGAYVSLTLNKGTGTTSQQTYSTTTSGSAIQGVVVGYVTVGPSRPSCSANMTCNVDLSNYSLVFTPQCSGSSASPSCQASRAAIAPTGHYSILLPAGNYTATGLYPTCAWIGCSTSFPKTVTVEGGMQLVFNVNIDTGIR